MKRIFLFICLGVVAIIPILAQQGFESGVPPSGWIQFKGDSDPGGNGALNEWHQSGDALNGSFSAAVLNETAGSATEDWMVSPRFDPPNNTKYVVFKQKQSFTTNYGNTYSIRISTTGGTPTPSDYQIVEQWDETTFSTDWTTKIVDVSSFNSQIYVAFVMTQDNGDDWFIDDVELVDDPIVPSCTTNPLPSNSEASATLFDSSLTLTWDVPAENVSEYEIFFGTTSGALSSIGKAFTNSFEITSLTHSTTYYWRAVPMNPAGTAASCTEWSFTTESIPTGSNCSDPIVVGVLPFNSIDNTANYLDDYSTSNCDNNYMTGDDVVYTYTPGSDTSINVNLSSIGANYAGLHVLDDCPNATTTCVAFFGNDSNTDNIDLNNISVTGGTTYYIVVSTWAGAQYTAYRLDITENSCTNLIATSTLIEDCDNSGGFLIDVNISDLGSATSVTISDDQGYSSAPINSIGATQIGPYTNGTNVVVTVTNDQDGSCNVVSDTIVQNVCPPDNNDCVDAIDMMPATTADAESGWYKNTTVATTNSAEVTAFDLSCMSEGSFGTGEDLWFKTRVPAAGDITITTRAVGGSPLTDTYIAVFDGSCGSLNYLDCDLDDETPGSYFSEVILTNMTVDDVLYVRVAVEAGSDGEFEIRAHAVDAVLKTEEISISKVSMFPNPTENLINFEADSNVNKVSIYNVLGQEVMNSVDNERKVTLDVSHLQEGVYIARVTTEENAVQSFRLIKK